jgi:hypothetical protein
VLIACPECSGKLSSAAPSCPHCGYVQTAVAATAAAAPAPVTAPAPAARPPEPPPPELILPSEKSIKKAARLVWGEWVHSTVWRMFIGAALLLGTLGILFLVFMLALKLNDGPRGVIRVEKTSTP